MERLCCASMTNAAPVEGPRGELCDLGSHNLPGGPRVSRARYCCCHPSSNARELLHWYEVMTQLLPSICQRFKLFGRPRARSFAVGRSVTRTILQLESKLAHRHCERLAAPCHRKQRSCKLQQSKILQSKLHDRGGGADRTQWIHRVAARKAAPQWQLAALAGHHLLL